MMHAVYILVLLVVSVRSDCTGGPFKWDDPAQRCSGVTGDFVANDCCLSCNSTDAPFTWDSSTSKCLTVKGQLSQVSCCTGCTDNNAPFTYDYEVQRCRNVAGVFSPNNCCFFNSCYCPTIIVLDASGSVTATEWAQMKRFVANVITSAADQLEKGKMQVGVVKYSTTAALEVSLGSNSAFLLSQLAMMPDQTGGPANTDLGLQTAGDELKGHTPSSSCRSIRLITHSKSVSSTKTIAVATALKAADTHIMAVGVTSNVSSPSLQKIVSLPTASNFIEIPDYTQLPMVANSLFQNC